MGETRPGDGAGTAGTGFDLFDRWLEHRHQAPGDGADERSDERPDERPAGAAPEEPTEGHAPAPRPVPPREGEPALSPPGGLSNSAGWAVLSAFRSAEPEPEPEAEPAPGARPPRLSDAERGTPAFPLHRSSEQVEAGTRPVPPVTATSDTTNTSHTSDTIEFAPRTRARRVVGLVLLASLAGTAAAAWAAYQDPDPTRVGTAATLAVLSLVIWALRAGSPPVRLVVRRGELEVQRGGTRHRFDLTSRYTPIDVVGDPAGPGTWRVLFHRRSMAPFVVDASMVDPVEFTRVLERYRPRQD